MEHSVFHNFHALVTKPNATKEELSLLCNDYPTTPLTWLALSKFLSQEEAKAMLLQKARDLTSVDLWRELLRLEETDVIRKYELAKEAVQSVGHDPRSGFIWAIFLGLYAALHNAFLTLVTKDQDEQKANTNSAAATQPGTSFPSATAPLIQLVPAEKSYSERHASTVGNLSISTFFTTATGTQGFKSATVENAMLTSPIGMLAPEIATTVSTNPPPPENLRSLVATGDLNLVSYCEYLRKLCVTPVQDVPVKSVKQILNTLMPEMTTDPAANVIHKNSPIDFESVYPQALFQRPTSAIVPALEAVSVPGWTRVLRLEMSNWLQIKETDAELFENRIAYFFSVALRQCANVPDIRFLYAQKLFREGSYETGLKTLKEVSLAAKQIELSYVIADVYDLLLQDSAAGVSVLCAALTQTMQNGPSENYACHKSFEHLVGSLIYQIVLRRLRQDSGETLEGMIDSVLSDIKLRPYLSEDLLLSLLLLAINYDKEQIDSRALLDRMLILLPEAPALISMQFTDQISKTPDYFGAFTSWKQKMQSRVPNAADDSGQGAKTLNNLAALALLHSYLFSTQITEITSLMNELTPGMLCTPSGSVDYQDYIQFATILPSHTLTSPCSTLLHGSPLVSANDVPLTSNTVKGVIELGRKLDTLIDIARQLRDGSLRSSKPADLKAVAVMQVFQKAIQNCKHVLTERQISELQQLTHDPACIQSLRVWLNDA